MSFLLATIDSSSSSSRVSILYSISALIGSRRGSVCRTRKDRLQYC